MKKFRQFQWMLAAMACALCLGLTACNNDDDDDKGVASDFSKDVYQVYEVNFLSSSQALVFANFNKASELGERLRLGKENALLANGFNMQYYPMEDGYDYRGTVANLAATAGKVTFELYTSKDTRLVNSISSDEVPAPDLSAFPASLKARQDYNIGFRPDAGTKVLLMLYNGASASDEVFHPTVLADGSFTAPAFTSNAAYTARVIVVREKNLQEAGPGGSGCIRALKFAEKLVRLEK